MTGFTGMIKALYAIVARRPYEPMPVFVREVTKLLSTQSLTKLESEQAHYLAHKRNTVEYATRKAVADWCDAHRGQDLYVRIEELQTTDHQVDYMLLGTKSSIEVSCAAYVGVIEIPFVS